MTNMLTGTMMEELANIIACVTGDARQRRTIYEADQDFERFGKDLDLKLQGHSNIVGVPVRKLASVPFTSCQRSGRTRRHG
jgi:hypothetical protein